MAELQYIEEIVKGVDNLRNSLENHVSEMCTLLKTLVEEINKRDLAEEFKNSQKKHFQDIYWSLNLHVMLHFGPRVSPSDELQKLGDLAGLTRDELEQPPDVQNSAIDPWSKLVEILSATFNDDNCPEGSKDHADKIMQVLKDMLKIPENKQNSAKSNEKRTLGSKNRFRPMCVAKVSHNDKWFVGSTMAVSHFLRPLCLYTRIDNFKLSLKKAIIFYQPLDTSDNQNWSSEAFDSRRWVRKPPCQNCGAMFGSLGGFIATREYSEGDSFLGACAEYCPVNQLLADDQDQVLSENESIFMSALMERNNRRCLDLFDEFENIACVCRRAYDSKDVDYQKRVFRRIRHQVHIFGLKPECNHHF